MVGAAIARILDDAALRERLTAVAGKIVHDHGDIDREMGKLEQLYYSLLD